MKIGVDVFPEKINPSNLTTYASKSITTLFYEPIYSFVKGRGLCNIYKIKSNIWKFELLERYWSNGELITSSHIINTFIYYVRNKLNITKELDVIKNWKQYRKGEVLFDEVGIMRNSESVMYIETICEIDIYRLFSNVDFTPLYLKENVVLPIGSGAFIPKENKFYKYSPNKYYYLKNNEILNLILVENLNNINLYFLNKKIELTPTTLYKDEMLKKLPGTIFEKESNIHVALILNSEKSKKHKTEIEDFIKNINFENIIKTEGYFFENRLSINNIEENCKKNNKILDEFIYGVTKYYPNFENVRRISLSASIKELPLYVSTSDFLAEDVDIIYSLFRLNIENEYSLLLSYIPLMDDDYVDRYIKILNEVDIFKLSKNDKKRLNDFLSKYLNIVPIGNIKHKYKNSLNDNMELHIDINDCYYLSYGD